MKINMEKWAMDIIASTEVKALPILFFPCLPLAGKGIIEVVNDSQAHFEAMKTVIERFPSMIGAITGMDLTTEAETFGCEVKFKDTEAPCSEGGIASSRKSVERLKVPSVNSGRGPIFLKAAELAAGHFTDRPVFGGLLGPFSLAAVLMGLETTLKSLKKDAEAVHLLLDKCTEYGIAFARAYKEAGANGVLVAEPTAGLLAPKQCDEFSSLYVKKIVDAVQDEEFFVILHDCGFVTKMVSSMVGTGAKGHHFGNAVNMLDILPQIPKNILVFGNIDPSRILTEGTPEKVKAETISLLEKMKPFSNFVLSSGCDIPPSAPLENMEAFFEALEDFNTR